MSEPRDKLKECGICWNCGASTTTRNCFFLAAASFRSHEDGLRKIIGQATDAPPASGKRGRVDAGSLQVFLDRSLFVQAVPEQFGNIWSTYLYSSCIFLPFP